MLTTVTKVLDYYDFPRMIEATDAQNNCYLGLAVADQGSDQVFYFVPVTPDEYALMLNRQMDVRTLFMQKTGSVLWAVGNYCCVGYELELTTEPTFCWPDSGWFLQ